MVIRIVFGCRILQDAIRVNFQLQQLLSTQKISEKLAENFFKEILRTC